MFSSVVFGETIFGPNQYDRTADAPNTFTEIFSAIPGEASITVTNGDESGEHRVTSALIYINDEVVINREYFTQKDYVIEIPLQLLASNSMTIELASKPGTYLSVEITQQNNSPLAFDPIADQQVLEEQEFTFTVHAQTINLNPLIYSVSNLPSGATFDPGTQVFTWIPSVGQFGGYNPEFTVTDGQITLTMIVNIIVSPNPPVISVTADPPTVDPGQSATLTWTSLDADTVSIDNGIGTVELNGSLVVMPSVTTTYTITATGPGGTISAQVTVSIAISGLTITFPSDSDTIQRSDVMVKGTINNSVGQFSGIRVNGVYAIVDGDSFVANHVDLQPGENTITAVLFLSDGQTDQDSVTVIAEPDSKQVSIQCMGIEEGLAPLEITLKAEGNFLFDGNPVFSYDGPGLVEFLPQTEPATIQVRIIDPGVYYFSVQVTDSDGVNYTDKVAVNIIDKILADAMLKAQWEGMKTALAAGDIEKGLIYFIERARDKYRTLIQDVADLPAFAGNMEDIEMIYFEDGIAKYRIHRTEDINGTPTIITYFIYFTRDTDGMYKIYKF